MAFDPHGLRSIVFDVFGTVVDWFGTIVATGTEFDANIDWPSLAGDWLTGYRSRVEAVRLGQRPWAKLDVLLDEAYVDLAAAYRLDRLDPADAATLRAVWHHLAPWPDTLPALQRLRSRYTVGALSNGNLLLLTDMKRHSGLGWDCILSAELFHAYKPADAIYRMAVESLGTRAGQVLYVAAHKWDVQAGQLAGLHAGYVRRWQLGKDGPPPEDPDPRFDFVVDDLEELATRLGT